MLAQKVIVAWEYLIEIVIQKALNFARVLNRKAKSLTAFTTKKNPVVCTQHDLDISPNSQIKIL